MRMPTVSVIMPSFNSQAHIAESIASVQKQSFENWEFLVVDGGSTDHTYEIVHRCAIQDHRIRWISNPDDQGPAHARARGIRFSKGYYLAFLDADDTWLPDKLEKQILFMQKNGYDFTYTRYRTMWSDGKVGHIISMSRSYTFSEYLRKRGIGNLTVMASRKLFTDSILSTCRRSGGEDTLWWLLVMRNGATARLLDEDLARYRSTPGSLSKNQIHTLRTVWSMYRRELDLSPVHTFFVFAGYFLDVFFRRYRASILKGH